MQNVLSVIQISDDIRFVVFERVSLQPTELLHFIISVQDKTYETSKIMMYETTTTKFWWRSRKKSLVKFSRKYYYIHAASWLLGFVWLGNLTIHHSKQNLLHFYFFGISCWLIAIALAIWYNNILNLAYY